MKQMKVLFALGQVVLEVARLKLFFTCTQISPNISGFSCLNPKEALMADVAVQLGCQGFCSVTLKLNYPAHTQGCTKWRDRAY